MYTLHDERFTDCLAEFRSWDVWGRCDDEEEAEEKKDVVTIAVVCTRLIVRKLRVTHAHKQSVYVGGLLE